MRWNLCAGLIVILAAMRCVAGEAGPATTQPTENFVRFERDGHGGGKMQAALGHYQNGNGIKVDLLSTMHIGDSAFFHAIARQFPKYDAVLYELVAPHDVPPTEEGVNDQQLMIARDCDLDNQGPHINYLRPNFVHADLSLEEIQKLEVEKHGTFKGAFGEGPGIKAARDERDTAGQREVYADLQASKVANVGERIRLMRRAYSQLLEFTARPAPGQTYPAGMEVLVGARNDQVMRVLEDQINGGKKNLAVFYGAAHMVDLESRLFKLGFKRQSLVWQATWTVAPDPIATTRLAR